jgi:hypothetical protein
VGVCVPPVRLSHAVQEISECFLIVCLSLKDPTMDSTGVLCLRGRGGHIVPTLSVDLSDVGVRSGFVHKTSMAPPRVVWGVWWTLAQLAQRSG